MRCSQCDAWQKQCIQMAKNTLTFQTNKSGHLEKSRPQAGEHARLGPDPARRRKAPLGNSTYICGLTLGAEPAGSFPSNQPHADLPVSARV